MAVKRRTPDTNPDRLDGIGAIAEYIGVSRQTYYRNHHNGLLPYLIERTNWGRYKGPRRAKWYTFKDLVRAYLLRSNIPEE